MIKIEIDEELFEFLEENVMSFGDTPNSVLRRLLLGEGGTQQVQKKKIYRSKQISKYKLGNTSEKFVRYLFRKEFEEDFRVRSPYRMMLESENFLVYFQNFNKPSDNLWYRVNEKPLEILRSSDKTAIICFTNPVDKIAYVIPVRDIEGQIANSGWSREYLEVNIDHVSYKWRELDWDIKKYLKRYNNASELDENNR